MIFKMSYLVKLNKQPIKFLKSIPVELKKQILNKLNKLKEDPFYYLEHFEGESYYKLRIGNYRALVDINFKEKEIYVRLIQHRKKIYKK